MTHPLKLQEFIDALVSDTLEEKLEWRYLDLPTNFYGNALPHFLITDEYRQIDFRRSYYCLTNAGLVFLIYSLNQPGEETKKPWDGYELHIQADPFSLAINADNFELLRKSDKLYRLENAIRSKVSQTVKFINRDENYYLDLYFRGRTKSL